MDREVWASIKEVCCEWNHLPAKSGLESGPGKMARICMGLHSLQSTSTSVIWLLHLHPIKQAGEQLYPCWSKRKLSLQKGYKVAQSHIVTEGRAGLIPSLKHPGLWLLLAFEW